jgi:hypothetical protein
MTQLNRRSLVAGDAATRPVVAVPAVAQCVLQEVDPIFAAIERCRLTQRAAMRAFEEMDGAICDAQPVHGERPLELIGWRNYGHIGGHEIDRVRQELLNEATTQAERIDIEGEYEDAKARYAEKICASNEWDQKARITPWRARSEAASDDEWQARRQLARTRPTTPSGAGAVVAYALSEMDVEEGPWHVMAALGTAAESLFSM